MHKQPTREYCLLIGWKKFSLKKNIENIPLGRAYGQPAKFLQLLLAFWGYPSKRFRYSHFHLADSLRVAHFRYFRRPYGLELCTTWGPKSSWTASLLFRERTRSVRDCVWKRYIKPIFEKFRANHWLNLTPDRVSLHFRLKTFVPNTCVTFRSDYDAHTWRTHMTRTPDAPWLKKWRTNLAHQWNSWIINISSIASTS